MKNISGVKYIILLLSLCGAACAQNPYAPTKAQYYDTTNGHNVYLFIQQTAGAGDTLIPIHLKGGGFGTIPLYKTAPTNGQALVWSSADSAWEATTLAGISAVYSYGVPVVIHGGDSVAVNLIGANGITISAGAAADTIKNTAIDTAHQAGPGIVIHYGALRDTFNVDATVLTTSSVLSGDLAELMPNPIVEGLHLSDTIIQTTDSLPTYKFLPPVILENAAAASDTTILPKSYNYADGKNVHRLFYFEKTDSTTHTITIRTSAGDSLNGSLTNIIVLSKPHDNVLLIPGTQQPPAAVTNWTIIAKTIAGIPFTGVLPVANGGTGQSTLTQYGAVIGEGTAGVHTANYGFPGQVLTTFGSAGDPLFIGPRSAQYSFGTTTSIAANTQKVMPLSFSTVLGTAYAAGSGLNTVMPDSGSIRYLYISTATAPGAGQSYTFTLLKNGVSMGIVVTLVGAAAKTGYDIAHTVAFHAGDEITLQMNTSATANALTSFDGGVETLYPQ